MNNTEVSERETRKRLARPGFAMLSRSMLAFYIEDGGLPAPVVRNGRKYFKLSDINLLLSRINRPTPVPSKPKAKTTAKTKLRRCFVNAGYTD
jgi:hypothetical protein